MEELTTREKDCAKCPNSSCNCRECKGNFSHRRQVCDCGYKPDSHCWWLAERKAKAKGN